MLQTAVHGPITRIHLARTILGRPLRTVEAYLVDGLLIESGPPATASEMLRWCRGQDVRQVVNTHHHEDHAGGDSALRTTLGLPVAAPAQALSTLRNAPRLQLYRRLVWGQPADVEAQPLSEVVETPRHRFVVLPTPGHSLDHVCLFEPQEGWLFSGDLFIHERARYLRMDEDAHQILASLRRVLALRPRLLICSHAGFVEDGYRAIERKIAYWEGLIKQARTLRQEGLSVERIAQVLLGPEGMTTRVSRGHFSKRNLISSLLDAPT
jgi:glyoxylase-like metal-dependent hydrolase (beta-lactamase superfamily II)